jgi:indole-3-glycerol phosphate synthase
MRPVVRQLRAMLTGKTIFVSDIACAGVMKVGRLSHTCMTALLTGQRLMSEKDAGSPGDGVDVPILKT